MSQISSLDPNGAALRSATPNGFSSLNSEDFIRIMFTELSNQDPFQPSDSSALLDQMNSIRSIESNIDLMDRLNTLVFENKLSSASNLIGKTVQGLSEQGVRVAGTVDTVLRQGEEVGVQLESGWIINVKNIELIVSPPATDATDATPDPEPAP